MEKLLLVVGLCLLATTSATWNGCGAIGCKENNQCNDALCSKCDDGKCVSGLGCNSTCKVDSDCERLRYCYLCTNYRCSPGPRYPYKCDICESDSDCSPVAYCNRCIAQTDPISKKAIKACGSGCNGLCETDYDCGLGSKCSHCDQTLKRCQVAGSCGALCGSDADCQQNDSPCKLCIDATCSANCNQACFTNYDCNAPITGCGICTAGKCRPGATCGTHCNYDRDCGQAGACTRCVDNKCAHVNCGNACTSHKDCSAGSCPSCTDGKCTAPMCNSTCSQPIDCGAAGNCTGCTNGLCTYPTCGSLCNYDAECALSDFNCTVCAFGRCTLPQCGSRCVSDVQCARAGQCIKCIDNQCVPPTEPGTCGIHRACHNGNNNDCPPDTCTHCDPFTTTCRIGFPCGAACIVSSDCNQLGSCTVCQDVCTNPYHALVTMGLSHMVHNITTRQLDLIVKQEDAKRWEKFVRTSKQDDKRLPQLNDDDIDSLKKQEGGWVKYLNHKVGSQSEDVKIN